MATVCQKCLRELPDGASFCCFCGYHQREAVTPKTQRRRTKNRPNGSGTVFKRGSTYTCRIVVGWHKEEGKEAVPIYRSKGGFATRKAALDYLPEMSRATEHDHPPRTFKDNYCEWEKKHSQRVTAKTMEGYATAFEHFARLHHITIDKISANDLQETIDTCGCGKRTKQLMKTIAGLVFKFAIDDNQVLRNVAANLYTGNDETKHYEPLSPAEVEKVEKSGLPYSDYVVAMCYLGHRPAEFFSAKKSDYHEEDGIGYIFGGIKTEAGRSRPVTIPPKIQPIIKTRLAVEGTEYLFPRKDYNRKGEPVGYSKMPVRYFNQFIWRPMMARLGIEGKVPYATRHTYANKVKSVAGADKDKATLMGHESYETTKKYYQSTSLQELKRITDQLE